MYARIVIVPNFALEAFYNRTYRQLLIAMEFFLFSEQQLEPPLDQSKNC